MTLRNPVVSVLATPRPFDLEIVDGTPFELLVALYSLSSTDKGETWAPDSADGCPPATGDALAALGDPTGDVWLRLLGLAFEAQAHNAAAFVEHVRRMQPLEVRRHLLGLYVPSWCRTVGAETIERAAGGEAQARERLAADALDYCADSAESLASMLPLDPVETQAKVVAALDQFERDVFRPHEDGLRLQLAADADAKRTLLRTTDHSVLIESAAGGYRYEHDATFERVVLIPHFAGAPAILLCEHRTTYIICYPALPEPDVERSLLAIGRALGDGSRVAILARLRDGDANLGELADAVGLAKSTIHHHLVRLRAARLITVRGNTQGYSYALDSEGFSAAEQLLASFNAPTDARPLSDH